MEQVLYLAYGSNLNLGQMSLRCPGAKALGSGQLPGWRLAFRGAERGYYLTLLPEPEGAVPVGVWSVTQEDVVRPDGFEAFGLDAAPLDKAYREVTGTATGGCFPFW